MIDVVGLIVGKPLNNKGLQEAPDKPAGDSDNSNLFSGILAQSMVATEPHLTGKTLPEKSLTFPDLAKRPEKINVVTVGETPSDEDITNFALKQGINPDAIKALMTGTSSQARSSLNIHAEVAPQLVAAESVGAKSSELLTQIPSSSRLGGEGLSSKMKGSRPDFIPLSGTGGRQSPPSINNAALAASDSEILAKQLPNGQLSVTKNDLAAPAMQASVIKVVEGGASADKIKQSQLQVKINADIPVFKPQAPLAAESPARLVLVKLPITEPMLARVNNNTNNSASSGNLLVPTAQILAGGTQAAVSVPQSQVFSPRQDLRALSNYMSEAIGKKVAAQIAKGEWRVELELHPRSLGRIEVQLEFRNGDLEATFTTNNSLTRELLSEGLPRLRQSLEEGGTENALLELELANSDTSDENMTPAEQPEDIIDEPDAEEASKASDNPDQGLNIFI